MHAVVYDLLGRRTATIADRSIEAGRHDFAVSTENLASGLYLVRVQVKTAGDTEVFTEKVSLVR